MSAKLGLTGASGRMGQALLRHVSARVGHANIVALTRTPAAITSAVPPGVQVRAGDFDQLATLADSLRGVVRLVIVPANDIGPDGRDRQHADAIDVAVRAGVRHIIYISTVSARPHPTNRLFGSHFATEQALIASGVNWTILRMGVFTDALAGPAMRALASGVYEAIGGAPAAYVTRDDIAAAAAGILTTPGHVGVTYHATGPAALSQPEVADAIARAAGQPVRYVELSDQQLRDQILRLDFTQSTLAGIVEFWTNLRDGAFDLVTHDVERLSGRPAQTVSDFFRRSFGEVDSLKVGG